MRTLLALLCIIPLCICDAQLSIRNPAYVASVLKPAVAAGASFPSGATHYWAFESNLNDGVGIYILTDVSMDSTYSAGKNGNCVNVSDVGQISTDANTLDLSAAYSIVFWINHSGANASWNCGSASITINDAGSVAAIAGATADAMSGSISLGAWNLIVMTYDGSSVEKLSVNGADFVTGVVTVEQSATSANWQSGDATTLFDECAFFDRAITITEVSSIYNSGTGRFGP